MHLRACLLLTSTILLQLGVIAQETSGGENTNSESSVDRKPFSSSMTIVPPVPVTDQVEAEIRISIRNHSVEPITYHIVVTVDPESGDERPLMGTPIQVPALGQKVFSRRIKCKNHIGKSVIRYSVTDQEGVELQGEWPLTVIRSETRSLPILQIGWIDPGAYIPPPSEPYELKHPVTERDVRESIDRLDEIGMKGLIITYPDRLYAGGGVFYPSKIFSQQGTSVSFDVVGTILNQASKNGQHVFLGLGRGTDLLLTWDGFDDPERIQSSLNHSMKMATELWTLYSHEPSLYGWYLSHEANDIRRASTAYYNPMTAFLRTFEADKPVMISPSGTPIHSPEILSDSLVDIFAYQDAVGSGYVPYENTFDPQRRIETLEEVYSDYAEAHRDTDKHLWSNLEIWQMDGPEYANSYPPSFDRVQKQIEIEKNHVDVISSYTVAGFMEHPDSKVQLGGSKAVSLFESYREYYERVLASIHQLPE